MHCTRRERRGFFNIIFLTVGRGRSGTRLEKQKTKTRAQMHIKKLLNGWQGVILVSFCVHIRFGFHQKFANLQVPTPYSILQRGAMTARDVREGNVWYFETRVGD